MRTHTHTQDERVFDAAVCQQVQNPLRWSKGRERRLQAANPAVLSRPMKTFCMNKINLQLPISPVHCTTRNREPCASLSLHIIARQWWTWGCQRGQIPQGATLQGNSHTICCCLLTGYSRERVLLEAAPAPSATWRSQATLVALITSSDAWGNLVPLQGFSGRRFFCLCRRSQY